ncbi:MAG: GspE/PulE family protein [Patescibacteria group bacterium]
MTQSRVDVELEKKSSDISIIALVDALIEEAQARRASDIHVDPTPRGVRVRLRIDGVLCEAYQMPTDIHQEIISRIKVMTGLRTDEHQATQDGRFRLVLTATNDHVDVRVSIAPTYYGENIVMRLLKDTSENYSLEMLGFSESDRTKLLKAIRSPNGMILATGPTGSGKTTTLYTLLKLLNRPEVSIVTLEDPIEYAVADIEQIQVNPRTGLTFANGLRSILRQDPDIIMVGEIRDVETASIAVNTALTGHLLLSTLHTNDAATTLPRLAEMGVEPYLVATTVAVAIGQRLVRRVCDHCKEEVALSDTERRAIESLSVTYTLDRIVRGRGCEECLMSGFKGRLCLNEVLVADNDIKDAILKNASSNEIARVAIKNGMSTMLDDGFDKVRQGLTTVSEVLRVVHD